MTFFLKVVVSFSILLVFIGFIAFSHFKAKQKKRQIGLTKFRSSKFPKFDANNPTQLKERREKILSTREQIILGIYTTVSETISICEEGNVDQQPCARESENTGNGYELTDNVVQPTNEFTNTWYKKNEMMELGSYKQPSDDEESESELEVEVTSQSNDRNILNMENQNEVVDNILPTTVVKHGYSLLEALIKKKNKDVRAYKIICDGQQREFKSSSQEFPETNGHKNTHERPKSHLILASPYQSPSEMKPNQEPVPDAYKYLKKPQEGEKKQAAYLNPYKEYRSTTEVEKVVITEPLKEVKREREEIIPIKQDTSDPNSQTRRNPSLHKKKNSTEIRKIQESYRKIHDSDSKINLNLSTDSASSSSSNELRNSELLFNEEKNNVPVPSKGLDEEFDHILDGVDLHNWNERFQVNPFQLLLTFKYLFLLIEDHDNH